VNIYMDVCCLNRPFDDQAQDRIYLEAEAILTILSRCENEWTLFSSDVVDLEIAQSPHREKREKARALCSIAKTRLTTNGDVLARAREHEMSGMHTFDSLHLALAEANRIDVLLTTDDRFIRAAKRAESAIRVDNPVTWLMEVAR